MRSVYLIAYDITCPKRYRQIYKAMCGRGDSMQYSIFRCELTVVELHDLKEQLWPTLNLMEDRVMIVDLGPIEGRGDQCIEFWGNPRNMIPDRIATII
ncbi:MAG: CRISPR-associated endonuclease Cas2 [Planctomycetaceae bacterium]|nr:CRISPR-associated endonuclease Cas2 [Planctomycetaceae bacterium]